MNIFTNRRPALAAVGVFLAVAIVASGIWLLARRGGDGPPPAGPPATSTASMTVKVYFHHGETVRAVDRLVPASPDVATAALTALLAGPTGAERDAGYWSHFSAATAGMLNSVRVGNGVAHADFRTFGAIIPNASSSAGSAALLAELDATVRQVATVNATVYSFAGDVTAFYGWLQMVSPVGTPPSVADARRVARDFLARVVDMPDPRDEAFRWVGPGIGAVDFRAPIGEDGRPWQGPVTTVTLQRTATSWTVIGASTDTISVTAPTPLQAITSPVALRGQALAYEGTVNVRVVQVIGSTVTDLGTGFVTGGGDIKRPFSGQVSFVQPAVPTGWVLFVELSALNGEVTKATAVPVAFAGIPARAQILELTSAPVPLVHDGWVTLTGSGAFTFTIRAAGASQVRLYLTPLGTGTTPAAQLLGTAVKTGNVFTYRWRYGDEPLLAELSVVATGPGGNAELVPLRAYHG